MLKSAYNAGRSGKTTGENFLQQISLLTNGKKTLPIYSLNQEELLAALVDNFSSAEEPTQDAKLRIDQDYNIIIEKEKQGYAFNYENAVLELVKHLDNFDQNKIIINLKKDSQEPRIKREEVLSAINETEELLKIDSLELNYASSTWIVEKKDFKNWIVLNPNYLNASLSDANGYTFITLDSAKVKEYLSTNIAPEINIAPQNAKFEIKNGRVYEFQESRDGRELNLDKSFEHIKTEIIANKDSKIDLIISEVKANIAMENVNNLGIKEMIGVGRSNFKGSPKNRRHNIKTGAATINGVLIAPNENFSLNSALGAIDGEHGYLPELVIKGNKTTPEYGGGLCQIGTTLFRTALNTGLPITERQNHSYRVSYYEPAGTDATVYNPRPDMRFINDTGLHILIQTKIEGDDLIFEFWGTKDGRVIEKDEPRIYNIVKPGPTKIIETEDLAPGEKKCTEISHNGADAEFKYKVTYPDGEIKERFFKSHYKPWQAVCLMGKEKASSTEETLIE